ncbi:MAG: DUF59 domain-containing protein, partial [Actinobacteria bacterium]|nr:DUF59 domain-containing protein [Actinomycetota bacterium]
MTPLDDVRAHVQSRLPSAAPVTVPFDRAAGLVLAADVSATENVPPFDNTAVDGYAVRAADTSSAPCELRVTGEMAAGAQHVASVETGTAVRIMTGAPLPDGCDAIVMVEDTERVGDDRVRINRSVSAGDGIRRAGSDVVQGEVPLRAGTVVTAAVQAVLSTVNARTVSVWPRPRVGVISTGDELVDDGSPLQPGQIRESNRTMLLRLVSEAGAEAVDLGIVRDVTIAADGAVEVTITPTYSGCPAMFEIEKDVREALLAAGAAQVAVRSSTPLVLCTLPSFLLIGIAPMALAALA